jgi:hypothetical protein
MTWMVFIAERRDNFVFNRGVTVLATWGEEFMEIEVAIHFAFPFVECDMFLSSTTDFERPYKFNVAFIAAETVWMEAAANSGHDTTGDRSRTSVAKQRRARLRTNLGSRPRLDRRIFLVRIAGDINNGDIENGKVFAWHVDRGNWRRRRALRLTNRKVLDRGHSKVISRIVLGSSARLRRRRQRSNDPSFPEPTLGRRTRFARFRRIRDILLLRRRRVSLLRSLPPKPPPRRVLGLSRNRWQDSLGRRRPPLGGNTANVRRGCIATPIALLQGPDEGCASGVGPFGRGCR